MTPRRSLAGCKSGGLEVLYTISNIINTTQDRAKVLKAIMREVVKLTRATSGSIAMLNPHRGILAIETAINIPAKSWKGLKLQLGVGVTGWAAYKGETVRVDDVFRDPHYVAIKQTIRSELAVPMFLHRQVIGVINVDSTRRGAFTEDDARLLQAVAEQAAKVIETARLYEEQKRHNRQMEALFEVGRQLSSPAPVDAVLQTVVREGRLLLKADVCAFVEYREDKDELAIRAQEGAAPSWLAADPITWRSSILGPVITHRAPLFLSELHEGHAFWGGVLAGGGDFRSLVAVPVVFQKTLLGVLVVLTSEPRSITEHETRLLTLLASQTAAALENARRLERIHATEDDLHRVERFSLMGSLAAEIAHEIRNPVTIINLIMDSLIETYRDNETTFHDLSLVREKVSRIDHIVEQTLAMARNPKARSFERQPIGPVVADVLLFLNYKVARRGIEVETLLPADLPELEMDRGQMQQVFLNLAMNAIEAMPDGGRLSITAERIHDVDLGDCVAVSVRDEGPGIARENVQALFEPFYTTRAEGTGLGLFITRKLVANHNGDVRVQSFQGKGSTFTVLLPVKPPEEKQTRNGEESALDSLIEGKAIHSQEVLPRAPANNSRR
ncbi:MAG: hypothetical protein PWP23_912 [Candidatus Sumerlaeota bacterium]|nr:hypothetical protein [Candidatus Sumerlaeota bacterium]